MTLNESAQIEANLLEQRADAWCCSISSMAGTRILDCGVKANGGLQAGLQLAKICLAGLGEVSLIPGAGGPMVQVYSDQPVRACLASQYAGWQIKVGSFFGMGSGAMRAAYGSEKIFEHLLGGRETPSHAVGVLETKQCPTEEAIAYICQRIKLPTDRLTLAVAPASSIAGTIQVVARSLETALHKLHELHFDLTTIVSGYGTAPLPPVANNEGKAIGWTNDAILYGGHVVLWVRCEDEVVSEIGPKVPSSSSSDHGVPFGELFKRYQGDFYKIDPLLFSPAVVEFRNMKTGRVQVFGRFEPNI